MADRRRHRNRRCRFPWSLARRTSVRGARTNLDEGRPRARWSAAGIGCHALVLLMDEAVGDVIGLTQMGGEGAQWIGMAPFIARGGTCCRTSATALSITPAASRSARRSPAALNITYKLLYNSAVAMTGGQQAVGALPVTDLARALLAEGVHADHRHHRRAEPLPAATTSRRSRGLASRRAGSRRSGAGSQVEGVTVLIHDQECATELRRKRKRGTGRRPVQRVMINERVCEGCGDCGEKSNCLSVQPVDTEFGRKTRIDQSSCNKDFSCLNGDCPSFLTIVPRRRAPQRWHEGTRDG